MKPEDFEHELRRQPLRQVPGEWRKEILTTAESAAVTRRAPPAIRPSWLSTFNSQLSILLWPHPKAWAGLAAIWLLILAADFSMRDQPPGVAEKSAPPSPEVMVELRQQQRMLVELIGSRDEHAAVRSKSYVPQPRSDWRFEILRA